VPLRLQHRRRPRRGNRRSKGSQAQRRKDGADVVQVLDARHGEVRGGEVLQEPTEVDALEVGRKKPILYKYDMYLIYIYKYVYIYIAYICIYVYMTCIVSKAMIAILMQFIKNGTIESNIDL
jgi:hypothetical protein